MITLVHFLVSGIGYHSENIQDGEIMMREEAREQGGLVLPIHNSPLS